MVMLCQAFPDERTAQRAVQMLTAAGARGELRLLTGARLYDARAERAGAFAGSVQPDDPVGTFAGPHRVRRQAAGGFAGPRDAKRTGTFGDSDRDVVDRWEDGVAHRRVTGDHDLERWLRGAGMAEETIHILVDGLHHGRAAVIADVEDRAADPARALPDAERVA